MTPKAPLAGLNEYETEVWGTCLSMRTDTESSGSNGLTIRVRKGSDFSAIRYTLTDGWAAYKGLLNESLAKLAVADKTRVF